MKRFWWLGVIVIAGIVFRFYAFGQIPLALNRDETALGYNAFSIMTAGMDEWGQRWPLTFRSFGDYKLPGYIYTLSVFLRLFGTADWVVRLPSVLAGIGLIVVTYGIVHRLTHNPLAAMMSATIVSIQPWELFYSRMGYEAHLGLFLFLTSVLCWLHDKLFIRIVGIVILFAAVLTYNTPLLLLPLVILLLLCLPKMTVRYKTLLTIGITIVGVCGFLLLRSVTAQKQAITIMSDPTLIDAQASAYTASTSLSNRIWNNRYVFWIRLIIWHEIQSFSPLFLVLSGGQNPWHSLPGSGHIYGSVYLIALFGLFWGSWKYRRQWQILFIGWMTLFGSLAPSVITVDSPHATRSLVFLWLLSMYAGIVLIRLSKKVWIIVWIVMLVEFGLYSWRYFVSFPLYRSSAWPIGIRESLQLTRGKSVTISASGDDVVAEQVYIYPLWYWRVSPEQYNQSRVAAAPDVVHMNRIIGFENFSTSGYNQVTAPAVTIERHTDGSYSIK